jgi:hypothetical protein
MQLRDPSETAGERLVGEFALRRRVPFCAVVEQRALNQRGRHPGVASLDVPRDGMFSVKRQRNRDADRICQEVRQTAAIDGDAVLNLLPGAVEEPARV